MGVELSAAHRKNIAKRKEGLVKVKGFQATGER
jgi:hypothetical protein